MNPQMASTLLPDGCTFEQFRLIVRNSSIWDKCAFLNQSTNIVDITLGFRQLMDATSAWDLEQLNLIFSSACLLYLVNVFPTDPARQIRGELLTRMLDSPRIDCVDPIKVHQLVDNMLDHLTKENVASHSNLIHVSLALSSCSWRGRPAAVCILWAVIDCSLPLEIIMHRYRDLSDLAVAIKKNQNFVLTERTTEELQHFVLLLFAINKLIDLLLFNNNEELRAAGYPEQFFKMYHTDVQTVRNWFLMIIGQLKSNRGPSNVPYDLGIKIMQSLECSVHLFDSIQGTEMPNVE